MPSTLHIPPLTPLPNLRPYIILQSIIGSRAYGLDLATSDTDRRGIYLPPANLHWSLYSLPEQIEDEPAQECFWELQKFLILALKANPNILECLFSPLIEHATPLGQELLNLRQIFLSKLVHQTYNNYVLSQFKKLSNDLRLKGDINWKHAMHLIRLLLTGINILQTGTLQVRTPDHHREKLLAIKQAQLPWNEVNDWRLKLHEELDTALTKTSLPESPDYNAANTFLLHARRSMLDK